MKVLLFSHFNELEDFIGNTIFEIVLKEYHTSSFKYYGPMIKKNRRIILGLKSETTDYFYISKYSISNFKKLQ